MRSRASTFSSDCEPRGWAHYTAPPTLRTLFRGAPIASRWTLLRIWRRGRRPLSPRDFIGIPLVRLNVGHRCLDGIDDATCVVAALAIGISDLQLISAAGCGFFCLGVCRLFRGERLRCRHPQVHAGIHVVGGAKLGFKNEVAKLLLRV